MRDCLIYLENDEGWQEGSYKDVWVGFLMFFTQAEIGFNVDPSQFTLSLGGDPSESDSEQETTLRQKKKKKVSYGTQKKER